MYNQNSSCWGLKASPASPIAQCYLQLSSAKLGFKHAKANERNTHGF